MPRGPDEFSVHRGHTFNKTRGYTDTYVSGFHVVRIDWDASQECEMKLEFLNCDRAETFVPGEYVLWPVGKVQALIDALRQIQAVDWRE